MKLTIRLLVFLIFFVIMCFASQYAIVSASNDFTGFGLVYLHPEGNWTSISRIHWMGSPTQFNQVNSTGLVLSDINAIANANYTSILFQTCIACLNPSRASCFPTDFNYSILKQNLGWIAEKAKNRNLTVYVLYYPDFDTSLGNYYDEGSENWNLMQDFTHWCVNTLPIDYCAPFSLSHNKTEVEYFFNRLGVNSLKILMHIDQPYIPDLISLGYTKLLEIYDDSDTALLSLVKDANQHVVTGQIRQKMLDQKQQLVQIKTKLDKLGAQKSCIIWCYTDYPDSSQPENLGLVQGSTETLPLASLWRPSGEIDATALVTWVHDGDTFDIDRYLYGNNSVRLAEIDATDNWSDPEYYQARNYLISLVYNETVYLDIDDIYIHGTTGNRTVCVVYVNYNSTHYLNVNEALLDADLAKPDEYPNEFNHSTWTLYVSKDDVPIVPEFQTHYILSLFIALTLALIIIHRRRKSIQL